MQKLIADGRVWFGEDGGNMPRLKRYLADVQQGMTATTIWKYDEVGHNQEGRQELKKLFNDKGYFDGPKPLRLLRRILLIANLEKDAVVLDFFSGSATMAHAVMQLNAEDGGHRKFIMVQLPEQCDEKSEAYKAGYRTICDIGKERIRRAGKKIKEESPLTTQNLDTGFRVFKLDDTNMTDVYYSPNDYSQGMLSKLEYNVKSDRTDLDLLFGCLLDWGLPLSLPYSSEQIEGCTVHNYNDGDLIACFDENIPDSVIKEIAKKQPLRAVFRDSSFANSPSKINVGEIFKLLAPDTSVKVI
jgi:adenine-specific DNA-methyltransferase